MAFDLARFERITDGGNTSLPGVCTYYSTTDTLATIGASAYFNTLGNSTGSLKSLLIGDLMIIRGSDNYGVYQVVTVTSPVTVTNIAQDLPAGSITNSEISATAAIAFSKLAALTAGSFLVGNASNVATDTALTGAVTYDSAGLGTLASLIVDTGNIVAKAVTAAKIADTTITDAQISASAQITPSKLKDLTPGRFLQANVSGVMVEVALAQDINVSPGGNVTIQPGVITMSKLASSVFAVSITNITAAQFKNMKAVPIQLVAAGGANTVTFHCYTLIKLVYGTAAYAAGESTNIQYADRTASGSGSFANTKWAVTANTIYEVGNSATDGIPSTSIVNSGLYLGLATATTDFTTGDSDLVAYTYYQVIDVS